MISNALRRIVDEIIDKRRIEEEDVKKLMRDVLPDGATSREEIDVLVALDRAVPASCESWGPWLTATTIDHAVWAARPTGVVNRDKAQWLVASLGMGEGPTALAAHIAFEVVREADSCDEALVTFAMQHGERQGGGARNPSALHRAVLVS